MAETQQASPLITILPSPGLGHLIPLTQFARQLVDFHNFSVTFIISTDGTVSKAEKSVLDSLPKSITSIVLPPVNFDDLPKDVKIETRLSLTMIRSLPSLRETLKVLTATNCVSALVVDLFGIEAMDVAKEFNVSPYIFYPTTAMCLSLFLHLPKLDEMFSCEYRDMPEPVQLPGCVPLYGGEFLDPAQDRTNEAYKGLLHNCKLYRSAEGILVNTFVAMESSSIKAFKEGVDPTIPPVYPIGPLIQNSSRGSAGESECLKWLDDQPSGSVLYVSFGTGGALSPEQFNELALGLELSEQKFLWVVKSPTLTAADANYFTSQNIDDPLAFLPKGFLERTKGQGMMVSNWAPQIQVLSHGSTGGFLTHCGWNSTLESVAHGVPLIAWPLYAEQKMNAKMLAEEGMKIALRPKAGEDGIIGRVEIATMLRSLMEGEEGKKMRNRMRLLKEAASMVLSEDGSSRKALSEVADKWKAKVSM
ncbi:hydroquinone glucosyltransferase-like isoform X2 [Telopea speciosissima]|uniref:hydroquinone glucosyltransferase-like isoform X1 n=1 Tax=Telopea speciosissima TaxID=54955 RepID=UPI001CC8260D|nr:hydroquinone glucosyltransferase-like isoform X1 [Telopea speciosissima]XP_043696215.1 hydroquinone glucosyltransferase-like isoform X2 [Telopea speciosissima]